MPVIEIIPPEHFSFRSTIYSHGWCELPPFEIDEATWTLRYVFDGKDEPVAAAISEADGQLLIDLEHDNFDKADIIAIARHLLRIDDELDHFYETISKEKGLAWVAANGAGRLLRSQTVFEDLVKTICTTNCSWGLTKNMVSNLVEKLGRPTRGGKRSFPTAQAMAAAGEDLYRNEIRAGYRSPYFVELAGAVASGKLDPETWLTSELSTPDLKKEMKKVKGVGDYAAENLLKLLGRYDGLSLDSWLRSQFYKKYNNEKICKDARIERHYAKFGKWRGLAIWCEMTEKWIV